MSPEQNHQFASSVNHAPELIDGKWCRRDSDGDYIICDPPETEQTGSNPLPSSIEVADMQFENPLDQEGNDTDEISEQDDKTPEVPRRRFTRKVGRAAFVTVRFATAGAVLYVGANMVSSYANDEMNPFGHDASLEELFDDATNDLQGRLPGVSND